MAVWRRWWWNLGSTLLLLAALAVTGSSAWAQARPRIDGFDVERVAELAAGTRLNFSVFGSPGGQVLLHIDGARRTLPLREVQPGVYDGSYLLEPGEHIAADARVFATLRVGGLETRAMLDEPLLLGQPPVGAPRPVESLPPTSAPSPESLPAPAPRPAPAPMPAPADPRPAPPPATDRPPFERPTERPVPLPRSDASPCPDCAVVESIRPLPADDRPPASAPGTLLGGLFGEHVGQAVDRHVARVTGAVDRAVRGRPLDEPAGPGVEVVLRLPNGQRLVRLYDRAPDLRVGDTVRRSGDLGGARSERLLGAPPTPERGHRPRGQQLAGSPPP